MTVVKNDQVKIVTESWGRLIWFLSGHEDHNSQMTIGKCEILPGCCNPMHFHPNCQEALHVIKGTIVHSYNDKNQIMNAGDTILIPSGVAHNAKNISDETAEMMISFSSGDRQTTWVE